MADEKTFSESEHLAILADRVKTETADLTAERDQLESERTELQNKLDIAESAKVAAEQRAEEAEQKLEAFKGEVEEEREAAARKEERITKAREAAKHLGEDFFKDEARVNRIVAMKDEEFEGYLGDLQATAPAGAGTAVPRETAMSGEQVVTGSTTKTSAARGVLLGRYSQEG